jgi:hypothetical protein
VLYPPVTAVHEGKRVRLVSRSGQYFELYDSRAAKYIRGVHASRLSQVTIHKSLRDVPDMLVPTERKVCRLFCQQCGVGIEWPKRKWCSNDCKQIADRGRVRDRTKKEEPSGRKCPECKKSLTGEHGWRKFCSSKCGSRYRGRKYRQHDRLNNMLKKLCGICKEEFRTTNSRKKYCSKKCSREKDRLRGNLSKQLKRLEKREKRKRCRSCKKMFSREKSGRMKYCSKDCYKQAQNVHRRDWYRKYGRTNKDQ